MVAVGRADEVGGFALAGVEVRPCTTPAEAEAVMATVVQETPPAGLVVVSAWANRAAARVIARLRQRRTPPVVVTLPETEVTP
jgi:vacuolar-type H+-ATPase subunit F/Vma7